MVYQTTWINDICFKCGCQIESELDLNIFSVIEGSYKKYNHNYEIGYNNGVAVKVNSCTNCSNFIDNNSKVIEKTNKNDKFFLPKEILTKILKDRYIKMVQSQKLIIQNLKIGYSLKVKELQKDLIEVRNNETRLENDLAVLQISVFGINDPKDDNKLTKKYRKKIRYRWTR